MKKLLIAIILIVSIYQPMSVHATIITDEEVEIFGEDINNNQSAPVQNITPTPEVVIPSEQPAPVPEEKNPAPIEKTKKVQKPKEEVKEEPVKEETISENEVIEEGISEEVPKEEETKEVVSMNNVDEEKAADADLPEQPPAPEETKQDLVESKGMDITILKKICGTLLIAASLIIIIFFLFGHVKIFNLSDKNKFRYIGQCRIYKKKSVLYIYISSFLLNRGTTSEFKIQLSDHLLKGKLDKVYLVLPEGEKIEAIVRKEIQFQYD